MLAEFDEALDILMVEDNPGDIELTRQALDSDSLKNHLYIAEDGEQALDFLHGRNGYTDVPRPDLVLLDLNLPKVTGHEVLAAIKSNKHLSSIPVIILSSSEDNTDIQKSYDLNANSFVMKPMSIDDYMDVTHAIEHFWLKTVKLPRKTTQESTSHTD